MDHINVTYWGSLDTYAFQLGPDNYYELQRGEPTALPPNMASRLLRARPREFFRDGEEVPAKRMAQLNHEYATYPDRVIADARKLAAKYQQIADTCDHDDPRKKQAMIDGAMDTVNACMKQIFDHENLKRRRKGEPELEWEAPEETSDVDTSGNDDERDFGEAPKRRGRKAVAA